MNIKILGSGCKNCHILEKNVKEALAILNVTADIEKIVSFRDIMVFNVLSTPALIVNGAILFSGRVPSTKSLVTILKNNL